MKFFWNTKRMGYMTQYGIVIDQGNMIIPAIRRQSFTLWGVSFGKSFFGRMQVSRDE